MHRPAGIVPLAISWLQLTAVHIHVAAAARDGFCPPLGPVLPAPTRPSANPAVISAVASLRATLESLTANFTKSALSFGVTSIHESEPLLDFHHTPAQLDPRGVQTVTSDSVYRIASASKVFPVLATLMLNGVSFDDPITKYLPRLREIKNTVPVQNAITVVDWDEITLGSLAAHLAGLPADLMTDLSSLEKSWTPVGLPAINESEKVYCSIFAGRSPCNESDFYQLIGNRPPVYAPGTTPIYSNIGTTLLGLVVENVTGQPFGDFVKQKVLDPLGMNRTSINKPQDSFGVIPVNELWWNVTLGVEAPSGAYYSTTKDLLAFGTGILKYKTLTPAKTRAWLKPWTSTSSAGTAIGAPWEIYRSSNLTKDQRLIEIYTKGGDIFSYHSTMGLVQDYDLVVSVLVGGPEVGGGTVQLVQAEAIKALLPALEQAGKDEIRPVYAGTYTDSGTNSSITLALDDSPGFSITSWTVRGVDVIHAYNNYTLTPTDQPTDYLVRVRLYPTNLETENQRAWRSLASIGTPEQIAEQNNALPWADSACIAWGTPDRLVYRYNAIDYFVFNVTKGQDGAVATSLHLPAYNVHLTRAY